MQRELALIALVILDQLLPLQTRVSVLADDDVIVHGNAEQCGDVDNGAWQRSGLRRIKGTICAISHDNDM
jgi:hypothetical protein